MSYETLRHVSEKVVCGRENFPATLLSSELYGRVHGPHTWKGETPFRMIYILHDSFSNTFSVRGERGGLLPRWSHLALDDDPTWT